MIAALYVEENGTYSHDPRIDPWPESRDARTYDGPHVVIAHPPCVKWCWPTLRRMRMRMIVSRRIGLGNLGNRRMQWIRRRL